MVFCLSFFKIIYRIIYLCISSICVFKLFHYNIRVLFYFYNHSR